MRAGVAKVCITPPVGTWQGGYGARNRACEGVHDDLYARALVLESDDGTTRVAVVSIDIVTLTVELTEATRRRAEATTGIRASNIALCTSHTHGGPATRAYGETGPQANGEYLPILEQYLAGAVAAATRSLQPVTVRLGRGQAGFNVNRRLRTPTGTAMRPNLEGPVDREVQVIRIDPVDGASGESPLAVLFCYACHATAMGSDNYLITADYPGAAAAVIEQAYGGHTAALFLQGCAGNIRPHLVNANGGFRSADWTELAALGRELGGAVVAAAERVASPAGERGASTPEDATVATAGTTVLLPYGPPPAQEELRGIIDRGQWPDGREATAGERRWAGRALEAIQEGNLEPGAEAEVQVFRLGSVVLVVLPGEIFLEIGWRVRDAVAASAGVSPESVVVTAYANSNVGYVPTAEAIPEGGYEVTTYQGRGRPSGYAPEAEVVLARTAAELAAGLR